VIIVPIGIQYRYVEPPWKALAKLLSELEAESGLPVDAKNTEAVILNPDSHEAKHSLYQRLYRLGEHLLSLMEEFYTKFYHQKLSTASKTELSTATNSPTNATFAERLQALLDVALQVAEQYFNIQPKGSIIDRCRRLEQAGWDYIYREDIKNPEALSPLERGLADRIAAEANLRMWHMRLVESFVAVTGAYVLEKTTADRFAETTLLMWDMITRIRGGNPFHRPRLGKQWVQITVGQPISVSDRWDVYQTSRRDAKQSVANLTQDLQTALEGMIS
jgi:predicted transcriptional regulator